MAQLLADFFSNFLPPTAFLGEERRAGDKTLHLSTDNEYCAWGKIPVQDIKSDTGAKCDPPMNLNSISLLQDQIPASLEKVFNGT